MRLGYLKLPFAFSGVQPPSSGFRELWRSSKLLWRSYEAFRRIAEGMNRRHETNMITRLEMRPSLGSPSVRKLSRALMTKARGKNSGKRIFITLSEFEVLDFPVRVRPVESLGKKLCRTTVRVIRF
jgi:hypothetical protein